LPPIFHQCVAYQQVPGLATALLSHMACDEGNGHRVDSRRRVLSSLPTHLLSLKAPVPIANPAGLPLLRLESYLFRRSRGPCGLTHPAETLDPPRPTAAGAATGRPSRAGRRPRPVKPQPAPPCKETANHALPCRTGKPSKPSHVPVEHSAPAACLDLWQHGPLRRFSISLAEASKWLSSLSGRPRGGRLSGEGKRHEMFAHQNHEDRSRSTQSCAGRSPPRRALPKQTAAPEASASVGRDNGE
jgi:hypothetical protein